ncbi:MAG: hypothetical protein RRB13_08855 [bacterium]|nr:hypothetical protein [bacterium]
MINRVNPFHDLYAGDSVDEASFVDLFSPILVDDALPLYQSGNVVLQGLQGSGKTMLLQLLRPKVRIAYSQAEVPFPVPGELAKFISGGINLSKAGVIEFCQKIQRESPPRDIELLAQYFGDFMNFWIVYDIITTVEKYYSADNQQLLEEIGLSANAQCLSAFSRLLSAHPCWLASIKKTDSLLDLKSALESHIKKYRKFLNDPFSELDEFEGALTTIGIPIAAAADCLKQSKVISNDVNVLVRIDQYETLGTMNILGHKLGDLCQEVVHKALATRDTKVSYRVGARQYAWPKKPKIFKSEGNLEHKREYSIVSIDEIVRRSENSKSWIFPKLAEDIAHRRLRLNGLQDPCKGLLAKIFASTPRAGEKAKKIIKDKSKRPGIIKFDQNWPDKWSHFLFDLAQEDILAAKFADAWVRQKSGKAKKQEVLEKIPYQKPYPWDARYWQKERVNQALVQIASRHKQRPLWYGKEDVLGVSGGCILTFILLCKHIWDRWLQLNRLREASELEFPIPSNIQNLGILSASEESLARLPEGQNATMRQQFIKFLGNRYYQHLTNDSSMSNPGHTGFSIYPEDLAGEDRIRRFLEHAVDCGDLYSAEHACKRIKGRKRLKYYLAPIFCPSFKIPYQRTKEPEYIRIGELDAWLEAASNNILYDNERTNPNQLSFFD